MSFRHLRVYHGPEQSNRLPAFSSDRGPKGTVTVPLGDVVQALADAVRHRRGWVDDFAQDEVTISTDLYEIILAYQYYCRSAEA
ncbi:MAG: hypothetical protein U0795_16185 [Pirellulales bacterium]